MQTHLAECKTRNTSTVQLSGKVQEYKAMVASLQETRLALEHELANVKRQVKSTRFFPSC